MEDVREEEAMSGGKRWAARHMLVMTVSSLVLCLLVGSLLLMDVGDQALAPGVKGFLSGGAAREDLLLSGAGARKSAAVQRLAQKRSMWPSDNAPPLPGNARAAAVERAAKKQAVSEPQLASAPLKVVEATPLQSLAKATAIATAKIVRPKPAVNFVKAVEPVVKAAAPKPAAAKKAAVKVAAAPKIAAAKVLNFLNSPPQCAPPPNIETLIGI